jgi:tetratricopeptide (TPR) repeat protein
MITFLAVGIGCSTMGTSYNEVHFGPKAVTTPRAEAMGHYLTAVVFERRGEFAGAIEQMEMANTADPAAVTPAWRLVRVYVQRREFDTALQYAQRLTRNRPEEPRNWILLGEILHRLGRANDAAEALQKAIGLDPGDERSYDALARVEESNNDLVATADLYAKLTQLNPEEARFYYRLGYTHARLSEYEAAIAALTKALELAPDQHEARMMLGIVSMQSDDVEEAILHFRRYLIRQPNDMRARVHLAVSLARIGAFGEAEKEFATIVATQGAGALHNLQYMYVLLKNGQAKEAERVMPAGDAPFIGSLLRIIARRDAGEPIEALLENYGAIDGDLDAECNEFLNEMLHAFGKGTLDDYLLEAVAAFRDIHDSKPLAMLHGRIYMSTGRNAEGVEVLDGVAAKFGADLNTHYYLAVCHEELENFEATEHHLKAYLEEKPNDPDVLNFLGYMYAEHGVKLDEAKELIERALESEPESPFYLDSLGWVYYQMGDAKKALDLIHRALLNMKGDDGVLREHLGDAYLLNGEREKALIEWEKALRLDPKIEGLKEKIEGFQKPGVET